MHIINTPVYHNTFGDGNIIRIDSSYVTVEFSIGEKIFSFPKVFVEGFLITDDNQINEFITCEKIRLQQEETEKAEQEEKNKGVEECRKNGFYNNNSKKSVRTRKRIKINSRSNVAFKCNYCDGGETKHNIGFNGICSDAIIRYNINIAKHRWCIQDDCDCNLYLNGELSRKKLERLMMGMGYVCYESQLLRDWRAFAGITHSGENSGRPMRLLKVKANSLAVLTTRFPDSTESERIIFAVFLVDETFEGDKRDAGYVSTDSEFKIKLSPSEAHEMKFWNYYANGNDPTKPAWGSGLHRYFNDEQAAIILRDIALIKQGTKNEELAKCFYKYFCKVNEVDINSLSKPNGALTR